MTRSPLALAALSAAAFLLPDLAGAVSTARNTRTLPANGGVFEVTARSAAGAEVYWCGASDYARRVLGADWSAEIYVVRGRGPSVTTGRKTAVQFSLDPVPAGPGDSGALAVLDDMPFKLLNRIRPGDHMSVELARIYCDRDPLDP